MNSLLFNSDKKREGGGIIYALLAIEYYLSKIEKHNEEGKFLITIQKILEAKRQDPLKDVKKGSDDLMAAISGWLKLTEHTAPAEDVTALRKTFVLLLRLSAIGITKLQTPIDNNFWANSYRIVNFNIATKFLGDLGLLLSQLDTLQEKLISSDLLTENESIASHSEIVEKMVNILIEGVGNDSIDQQLLQVADGIEELNKTELNLKKEAMKRQKNQADAIIKMVTENSRLLTGQQYFVDLIVREEIGGRKGLEQFLLDASEENDLKTKLKEMLKQYDNPSVFFWVVKKEKADPVLGLESQKEHNDAKEVLDNCRESLQKMEALQKIIKKQSPQGVLEKVSVSKGRFEEETDKTLKDRVRTIRKEVERIEVSIPINQGKSPR